MKNKKLLFTAMSASLLLAACGTDSSEDSSTDPVVEDSGQAEGTGETEIETDENEGTEGTEGTEDEAADENGAAESDENETTEDGDVENGESADNSEDAESDDTDSDASENTTAELEGAEETTSDEQKFKMQVLPEYQLTSEEPGRDLLYVKEEAEMNMVIQTMDASEVDFDSNVENLNETLAASSDDATPIELTDEAKLPKNPDLEKVEAYQVKTEEGPVTGIIFQRGEMLVRVIIYDNVDESYYEDFLKMAETIQAAE